MLLNSDEVKFSLEKLTNCSFFDARNILNCKKKILQEREKVFLLQKDRMLFFEKSDYYIQKILLPSDIKADDDVFLTENVVAEFCNGISEIGEGDWWIYAAYHVRKLRIIAGIGKGIILSRFLSEDFGISDEIEKSVMYLQRFGMTEKVKIFSYSFIGHISSKIIVENNYIENFDDAEKIIFDFLLNNNKIKPVISHKNYIEKILSEKVLCAIAFSAVLLLFRIDKSFENCKNSVLSLEKNVRAENDTISLEINDKNFSATKRFIDAIKTLQNPLQLFHKTSEICSRHRLPIEQLLFEKQIKIKTSLSRSKSEKLKTCDDIVIEKFSSDEYEELGSNKKVGSIICIK
jgi:hypothetical protein